MLAEIKSQPELLKTVLPILEETAAEVFDADLVKPLERIFITGCGDSHHVGVNASLAFKKLAGLPMQAKRAMTFARYEAGFLPQTGAGSNLVIGISVSGSVARTYEGLLMAREKGVTTMALTATPDGRLATAGDLLFRAPFIEFPMPEGTITPGVRTFFVNQLALLVIAIQIGEVRGHLSKAEADAYRAQLLALADVIEAAIEKNDGPIQKLMEDWKDANEFVFVGAGPNFGTALFGAAKVLEASGDPAMGQDTEEWAHLQYFAREADTPTVLITAADRDLSRMLEVLVAANQIGRRTVVICPETASTLIEKADAALTFAPVPEMFSPLLTAVLAEMLAAHRADAIGETFFRNFEGGRSIEGGGGISRIRSSDYWESWQK
jgi:glucosamine--fructose-6-phosphate aminotransferase (isomerizing)